MTINETAAVAGTDIKMKIQYSTSSDFSGSVNDVVEIGSCVTTSIWCYGNGVDSDNDPITTILLGDATATSTHNESGISTSSYDHATSTAAEWEFTIKASGAAQNTTYYFRAYDTTSDAAVSKNDGEAYPSLVTEGAATLTFIVSGLSASTVTEGITTDFQTTTTSIDFGTLTVGTETEGAQRLTVTTNAASGYQIFIYERQELLAAGGESIDPINATNSSPAAWPADPSPGGYGYHAGDDTLSGGSTRFLVDDRYAQFETEMKEIAYSSIAVDSESTDMVFKVEITNQQEAGEYSSEVVYICVPVFN